MNRDNTRRGVNHSSLFLPLDATIRAMEPPKGEDDRGAEDSDSTGEDTIWEEGKSHENVDEENEEETFMSIGVDFGTT
jgi:hypothetical protein